MFGVYSSSVILMYSSILDEWVVSPDSVHGNWCPIFGNEIVFVAQGCLSFGLLSLLVYWVGVWAINDKPVPYCIALPFFFLWYFAICLDVWASCFVSSAEMAVTTVALGNEFFQLICLIDQSCQTNEY